MLRVTRAGGWIVVLETDYSSSTIDSDQTDLERRLALAAAQSVRSGYVARQLYRLLIDQGLADISVTVRPVTLTSYAVARGASLDLIEPGALASGMVTEEELHAWHAELERADARNAFFACINMILVSGRKRKYVRSAAPLSKVRPAGRGYSLGADVLGRCLPCGHYNRVPDCAAPAGVGVGAAGCAARDRPRCCPAHCLRVGRRDWHRCEPLSFSPTPGLMGRDVSGQRREWRSAPR
jgi:hypothetical protein